ncbi:glutamate-rich protein 1 [Notothenia coriiceps]|uniref:Glutamate-rich protein 1 n=1 Tax=Notothenia coriiceps TaxID=8208 RepID=A0A6I9MW96_9TELE|nr:PREDICTED: glutamate-rich protein 1 [Notothenia coriiceps]
MASRKEVFQSKVLRRLYPAAPKQQKEPSPPSIVDALSKKKPVKSKASQQDTDAGTTQSADNPGRRMYTALPPPADYKRDSEKSVTLSQLESINSAEDPAEESSHDSSEELDQDKEEEQRRRRKRRRKRKPTLHQDSGESGAASVSEPSTGQIQTHVDEAGEQMSKNKKRKLKKKRHKKKLLSMGLMPRAAALEFTYQKNVEEEEEDNERRAAEVSDFLRTTMEIYMSDSSSRLDQLPLLSGTVEELLSSVARGCRPTSLLKQLYSLKALVQQQEADKLEKALQELHNTSPLSAEETAAVAALFQYWITDILPMQGDKKTELSPDAPRRM